MFMRRIDRAVSLRGPQRRSSPQSPPQNVGGFVRTDSPFSVANVGESVHKTLFGRVRRCPVADNLRRRDCFAPLGLAMTIILMVAGCISPVFAFDGDTIVTHETDRYYFKDGQMLKLQGQYEMTYFLDLDKNTLTRTRIYDFLNNKIVPDETVYHIEKQLLSHPTNADRYSLKPSVRAVGQTSADSMEMMVIEEKFVEAVNSGPEEIILSRSKRLR